MVQGTIQKTLLGGRGLLSEKSRHPQGLAESGFPLPGLAEYGYPPTYNFNITSICVLMPYLSCFSFLIISIWHNLVAPHRKIGEIWVSPLTNFEIWVPALKSLHPPPRNVFWTVPKCGRDKLKHVINHQGFSGRRNLTWPFCHWQTIYDNHLFSQSWLFFKNKIRITIYLTIPVGEIFLFLDRKVIEEPTNDEKCDNVIERYTGTWPKF